MSAAPVPVDLSALVLDVGVHALRESGVCAAEAVAWLAGENHSDRPACLCPVIGAYLRRLNDGMNGEERSRIIPILPSLVGTRSTPEVESRRMYLCIDRAVRIFLPLSLRAGGFDAEAHRLATLAPISDSATALAVQGIVREARRLAYDSFVATGDEGSDAFAVANATTAAIEAGLAARVSSVVRVVGMQAARAALRSSMSAAVRTDAVGAAIDLLERLVQVRA